jgi:soluble cytochrome b562
MSIDLSARRRAIISKHLYRELRAMADYRFDAQELLAAARNSTGLSDFGPGDFREGLDMLVTGGPAPLFSSTHK